MGINMINYALQKNGDASVATGVQDVSFNTNGDIVVELRDGSTVSRPLKDIKSMDVVDGNLIVTYSDNTTANVGAVPAGEDGYSPIATVSKSGSTTTITVTDAEGTTTAQVEDGVSPSATDVISVGDTAPDPTQYRMWVDTSGSSADINGAIDNLFNS